MQTILIIDDDISIGNLEEEVLERADYAVLRAYSGTEALLLLKSVNPSLILLDLMLPGLSGEELLPLIKNVPIIVVSAKAAVQDKVDLLLGGAADYITKPFDTSELLARVAVRLRESYVSPFSTVYVRGDLKLDTASHGVSVSGKAGFADTDGIRNFKASHAEQRAGHGKIRASRAHIRGHPRLHRKFPENAHQQSPRKAA